MNFPKLRKTCERILALEDNFIIKMGSYTSLQQSYTSRQESCTSRQQSADKRKTILSGEHPCGTTYCIVGMLAHLDDYPEQYAESDRSDFDYHAYILGELMDYDYYADSDDNKIFDYVDYDEWLFDTQWPDSLEYAKIRAQYLLDNDFRIPDEFEEFTHEYLDQLTNKV